MTIKAKAFALIIAACLITMILVSSVRSALEDRVNLQNSGIVQYGNVRKMIWRTSHWLCNDPVYGINGTDPNAMPILVDKIHASVVIIYFKDSDMPNWQWTVLEESVDFWMAKGKTVWIMIGKTTLNETAGTPTSIQYVIDSLKGKIAGILIDAFIDVPPYEATQWLLDKKNQLANNSMQCGYYHGDGFSPNYGNPLTDVNASYLSEQGLIPIAWLMNDNSWKPTTFNLSRFWIDYDILAGLTGQSSAEIYDQWYLGNVVAQDQLKSNVGCESLVFMTYMADSWPNQDAISGMVSVANNWLA